MMMISGRHMASATVERRRRKSRKRSFAADGRFEACSPGDQVWTVSATFTSFVIPESSLSGEPGIHIRYTWGYGFRACGLSPASRNDKRLRAQRPLQLVLSPLDHVV